MTQACSRSESPESHVASDESSALSFVVLDRSAGFQDLVRFGTSDHALFRSRAHRVERRAMGPEVFHFNRRSRHVCGFVVGT